MKKYFLFVLLLIGNSIHAQHRVSLAGEWKFTADSLDIGQKEHWENRKLSGSIYLPGSTDEIALLAKQR